MKRVIAIFSFLVFITILTSSCMVGLNRDGSYRNGPDAQVSYRQGNGYRSDRGNRNREARNDRYNRRHRNEQPVLIIH